MTKDEFVAHWVRMIWTVARSMQRTYKLSEEDCEDIVQSVSLKLCKLNPSEYVLPAVRIRTIINNASRDELAKILPRSRNTFSLDEPLSEDSDSESLIDVLAVDLDSEDTTVDRLHIEELLSYCQRPTRRVLELSMGFDGNKGLTQNELATRFNTTTDQIKRIISDGVSQIKGKLLESDRYRAFEVKCSRCGTTDTLLVKAEDPDPTKAICRGCNRFTDCLEAEQLLFS